MLPMNKHMWYKHEGINRTSDTTVKRWNHDLQRLLWRRPVGYGNKLPALRTGECSKCSQIERTSRASVRPS